MSLFSKIASAAAVSLIALTATQAVAAEPIKEFRIGLLGGENEADRLRSNECLVKRFETLLGVPVKLFPAADYAGTMEGLKGGNLDYAELGASAFAGIQIDNPGVVEPVVTTEQIDGSTGYVSVMLVKADSAFEKVEDLKGKKLAYADPNSTSGYLVPVVALAKEGFKDSEFFSATTFAGGHEQSVLAVVNGDVDAGVTWASGVGKWEEGYSNGNLRKMVDKGMLDMSTVRQVWQSPIIPNGPIVIRSSLPQEVKDKVKASLLSFHEDDKDCLYKVAAGEINKYVPVEAAFYDTIVEARKATIKK